MKIRFFLISAFILSVSIANAQSVGEIMRISSSEGELSTSRVTSMGGAFTSLGADAGSIDINPAGLGMYRSGEFNFTPGLNVTSVTTNSTGLDGSVISNKTNNTKFNLANMAAIFYIPQRNTDRALKSITIGVSYNRSADFDMQSFSESAPSNGSISDFFSSQLEGINPNSITVKESNWNEVYRNQPVDIWGAMMNYNNLMIDGTIAPPYLYSINPKGLTASDYVVQTQSISRNGQTNNFSFSMGANINDWLYLGMTLGGRVFSFEQSVSYQEWGVQGNIGDFDELLYNRSLIMSGSAFDFKVGATIQPITGLRIGLAYHAPKVTFINEEYSEYQDVHYLGEAERHQQTTPYAINGYNVVSSQKLLAGISYRLGSMGILSFDYRLNLNNSIKVKNIGGSEQLNMDIQNSIRSNSEYRVGLELNVYRGLFVRGGFGYIESFYDYADKSYNKYGAIRNASAGLGYKGRVFYVDLAYQNSRMLVEPYRYYGNDAVVAESVIDEKIVNNIVTMTLGFKF